eukprot:Clim_evm12s4 gene=Clim_evmTU12s4
MQYPVLRLHGLRTSQINGTGANLLRPTLLGFGRGAASYHSSTGPWNRQGFRRPSNRWLSQSASAVATESTGQPLPFSHPHLFDNDRHLAPGFTSEEFALRRSTLMKRLATNSRFTAAPLEDGSLRVAAIVFGNATATMTNDIPYVFRQHSDFFYLTGFDEPGAVLLLQATVSGAGHTTTMSDSENVEQRIGFGTTAWGTTPSSIEDEQLEVYMTMFVPPKDPEREMWDGPRTGIQGAMQYFGADEAFSTSETVHRIASTLDARKTQAVYISQPCIQSADHLGVTAGVRQALQQQQESRPTLQLMGIDDVVESMRVIKTPAEIRQLHKVCDVSAEAVHEVMRATKPGIGEHYLSARLEYECRSRGCARLAYPPVVAAGNNANTLHYVSNDQICHDGDLILMDGGGELGYYSADITRVWPVNGKFSKPQADIYDAVLNAQKQIIEAAGRPNTSLDGLHRLSMELLAEELRKLGILPASAPSATMAHLMRKFYPHHVGHWLGMDVHDTGSVSRAMSLRPGMVVTIEPGLYFPKDSRDIPEEYRGIGIRIEDDVLIEGENQVSVLTERCVKERDAIEDLMRSP